MVNTMAIEVRAFALVLVLVVLVVVVTLSSAAEAAGEESMGMGVFPPTSKCDGSVGECMGGDEYTMDSEVHRRVLAVGDNYISYRALNPNRVPCSTRGAPYYNCRPAARANAYNRGCNQISLCRTS